MILEPKIARETFPFPLARTFDEKRGPNCDADRCIMWRWAELTTDEPGFKEAIQREARRMAEADGAAVVSRHKQAVAAVMADRPAFGLPDKPYRGWCGLAGKPEA